MIELGHADMPQVLQRLAEHDLGGQLRQGNADGLGDERTVREAAILASSVDLLVLHRQLQVHAALDL